MVEAARFYDRNEAFIARAALLNDGIWAEVRDNGYANMMFGMAIATGGYGLLVDEHDAVAARTRLREFDPGSSEALDWTRDPQSISSIPLAALGTASGMVMGAPTAIGTRHPLTFVNAAATAMAVMALVVIALFWFGVL